MVQAIFQREATLSQAALFTINNIISDPQNDSIKKQLLTCEIGKALQNQMLSLRPSQSLNAFAIMQKRS